MDKDKVLLVLHGKQAGNEEVRAAVAAQREAGIPLEPAAALALLDQTARPIDLGEVNGKLFLNMATGGSVRRSPRIPRRT